MGEWRLGKNNVLNFHKAEKLPDGWRYLEKSRTTSIIQSPKGALFEAKKPNTKYSLSDDFIKKCLTEGDATPIVTSILMMYTHNYSSMKTCIEKCMGKDLKNLE